MGIRELAEPSQTASPVAIYKHTHIKILQRASMARCCLVEQVRFIKINGRMLNLFAGDIHLEMKGHM
jgi:hypothetical protein